MNARIAVATRLGFREQARRPLLIALLVVVPFFFITKAIASTQAIPRRVGLPGGAEVQTTMRDIHGALMAAIAIAFLAGLCGAFIVRSAQQADRRLVVAGFRPFETMVPRLAVLTAATVVVLAVSLGVTAISFTPQSWMVSATGALLIGLTYACIGVLAGSLVGQLGATYLVLFIGMLGLGILQTRCLAPAHRRVRLCSSLTTAPPASSLKAASRRASTPGVNSHSRWAGSPSSSERWRSCSDVSCASGLDDSQRSALCEW